MTVLAITTYTGSEKSVKRVEAMLAQLATCAQGLEDQVDVVAVNNAASRPQQHPVMWHCHMDENVGFGLAVNKAIEREIIEPPKLKTVPIGAGEVRATPSPVIFTHVLVVSSDLLFPDTNWLRELLKARDGNFVCAPRCDATSVKEASAAAAEDKEPLASDQASAFCWLVPVPTILAIRRRFGVTLFHPSFSGAGYSEVAGAMLRKVVWTKPFKIVPRSFVSRDPGPAMNIEDGKLLAQRILTYKRSKGIQ